MFSLNPKMKATGFSHWAIGAGLVLFFFLFASVAHALTPIAIINYPPTAGTITPSSATVVTNQSSSFVTAYADQNGFKDIQYCLLLINTSTSGKNCFYGKYDRSLNKVYLRDDADSAWLGGYTPGTAKTISNSYVKLDVSKFSMSGTSSTLRLNWQITFKSTFTGTKNCYLYVRDMKNLYSGWVNKGKVIINVPDVTSPTGSIAINNHAQYTNAANVTLNLTATDNTGGSGVSAMQFSADGTNYSAFEPYQSVKSWTLSVGDGLKSVCVKFRDVAGNISTAYSAGITLDTTLPVVKISSPRDGDYVDNTSVQVQGTVDGVSFSETHTLTQIGENIITKTATDLAGNTSSAAVTVYYYPGQQIGTEGGTVTSPDGKIKLIIPAGALSQATMIRIFNLRKEDMQQATPGGRSLLSAVDCRPYGLVFTKPAQIIYTLSQAEVPGTQVELGLYDAAQGKILPTGQVIAVPVDGYNLQFSISHFSTYAAITALVPQGTPIGTGVKIPLPDLLTGAFSHAIPITVPPGRKGIQPSVGLSYRSSSGNSWVGMGFSLNPGYIVRSTRLGPPTYNDTQDTFYFITDAGTTELVHLVDNLYQAKIESSFTKFFKETDDSWRVVGKDGSVLRFGQSSDSKETSGQGTFSWSLIRATDPNGNYIDYHYVKDQGKSYLSRIDYTGNENGVAPTNSVEFSTEGRNDLTSSYISSSRIAIAKRLKEVTAKVNGNLVWRYDLEYGYSSDTNRSLLKSITQSGSDGKSLPEQKFTYQQAK